MQSNGADQIKALTRYDPWTSLLEADPEVSQRATIDRAAGLVDYYGLKELVERQPVIVEKFPEQKENEKLPDYIKRVVDNLECPDQGTVLHLGLRKLTIHKRVAEVGIPVAMWRAFESGRWMDDPEAPDNFREWAQSMLVDELDKSSPEASQLANVIEAVAYLRELGCDWLPKDANGNYDLEQCFHRGSYRRWRAVAGKILARREYLKEVEGHIRDADGKEERKEWSQEAQAVERSIFELAEKVMDSSQSTTDLDGAGRQKPGLPAIQAEEHEGRDAKGRFTVTLKLSAAQRALFRQRPKGILEYGLQGEQYDKEQWDYYEYRMDTEGQWSRRMMDDEQWIDNWEKWEGNPEGVFDQLSYTSPDLTVFKYWVKKGQEE